MGVNVAKHFILLVYTNVFLESTEFMLKIQLNKGKLLVILSKKA